MNRPLTGLLLGLLLGALDGGTAWFSAPELRPEFMGILMGSTFKGVIAGLVVGFVTRRTGSLRKGVVVGVLVGFALALPIAYLNATHYGNTSYWWKILLPPTVLGAFVGYGTVRFGRPRRVVGEVGPASS